MKKAILFTLVGAAMASCSGERQTTADQANTQQDAVENVETTAVLTENTWQLVDFAGEHEIYVANPDESYHLSFAPTDKAFIMETDCNNLSGSYVISGDSIQFKDILSTMRACPDEAVEQGMKQILPMITTYTVAGDSILLLRSDARIMATFAKVK